MRRLAALAIVFACGLTSACTSSTTARTHHANAPATTKPASPVGGAPTNARQVEQQICPRVPITAVNQFFDHVPSLAKNSSATPCRAISNNFAAWTTTKSHRSDLLTIGVFQRPFGKNCGLTPATGRPQQVRLGTHQGVVVNRGPAGGLFLCWSSAPRRTVLLAANTPAGDRYERIKPAALELGRQISDRL